jgi:hypothetical protein
VTSLRVEDHADPLGELDRLIGLDEAYRLAGRGDECVAEGRHDEAARLFLRASQLAPGSDELRFWAGLGAAQMGDMEAALVDVRAAIEMHGGWRELLARLPPDIAPAAPAVLERLER